MCFFLLSLVGTSMGADFFTGMDRRIGCFFDKSNDRYIKTCLSCLDTALLILFRRDLPVQAPLTEPLTIKGCSRECARMFYKYSGMQVRLHTPCSLSKIINITMLNIIGWSFVLLWELIWTSWSRTV